MVQGLDFKAWSSGWLREGLGLSFPAGISRQSRPCLVSGVECPRECGGAGRGQ